MVLCKLTRYAHPRQGIIRNVGCLGLNCGTEGVGVIKQALSKPLWSLS